MSGPETTMEISDAWYAGRDRSKASSSPFGGSGQGSKRAANPFGPDSRTKPFIEPANLSPTMKAIPVDDTPWYKKITLGQVVSHHSRLPAYVAGIFVPCCLHSMVVSTEY